MKLRTVVAGLLLSAVFALAPSSAALASASEVQARPDSFAVALPQSGDPNDFQFESLSVEYELTLDEGGRSVLRTTETFVALFPETDQNHGMQRAVPSRYDGHPTDIKLLSVRDENGRERPAEVEQSDGDDGDFMVITSRIDGFEHGRTTYVFEYEQHNVTHVPDDSELGIDEFYWDVNGTGWRQPFATISATVTVDAELSARLTGDAACYRGTEGSSEACEELRFVPDASAGEPVLLASAQNLGAFENLTIAVAFEPGSIVPRDASIAASPFSWPAIIAGIASILAALGAVISRAVIARDHPGRGIIVAEYLPPRNVNVLLAGEVIGANARSRAALIVDLAVRHNIVILEAKEGEYLLQYQSHDGLDVEEGAALDALFSSSHGTSLHAGTVTAIKSVDPAAASGLAAVAAAVAARSITAGYRVRKHSKLRALCVGIALALGVVAVISAIVLLASEIAPLVAGLSLAAGLLSIVGALMASWPMRPLTETGAALRDYLSGLKLYIGLAEADRLRMLQSPEGAERSPFRPEERELAGLLAADSAGRTPAVLRLYERLLPYAVLFGQEKQWSKALAEVYERDGLQPDWWNSQNGFSVALFASSIGSFSASAQVSWASSSGSSSSGGSSGGGSSGGGGGGGGGGGV